MAINSPVIAIIVTILVLDQHLLMNKMRIHAAHMWNGVKN